MMAGELDFEKPLVELRSKIDELRKFAEERGFDFSEEIARLETQYRQLENEMYSSLTAAQKMHIARHHQRPTTLDFIQAIFTDFWSCTATGCSRTIWRSSAASRS